MTVLKDALLQKYQEAERAVDFLIGDDFDVSTLTTGHVRDVLRGRHLIIDVIDGGGVEVLPEERNRIVDRIDRIATLASTEKFRSIRGESPRFPNIDIRKI